MKDSCKQKVLSSLDDIFNLLYSVESIIKMTHKVCLNKEIQAIYYDLPQPNTLILSEERNHYINMLDLAIDKLNTLKELNCFVEKELTSLK